MRMQRPWKIGVITAIAAVLTGCAAPRTDLAPTAKVAVPRNGSDGSPVLTATGRMVPGKRTEVTSMASGRIVTLPFEQGDRVQRGQVLAQIDDEIPRARVLEAVAQVARSRAALVLQESRLARTQQLSGEQRASDLDLADSKGALEEARADVEAAEARLVVAKKVLGDYTVAAPISGTVLARGAEVGQFVAAASPCAATANSPLAVIADLDRLQIAVDVSELDIARLRHGMPCVIVPKAYPDRQYNGRLVRIDRVANYESGTVRVNVLIEKPDENLRVGGAAEVRFFGEAEPPAARGAS
jgi:RND family efflux transporter MFP subunit